MHALAYLSARCAAFLDGIFAYSGTNLPVEVRQKYTTDFGASILGAAVIGMKAGATGQDTSDLQSLVK